MNGIIKKIKAGKALIELPDKSTMVVKVGQLKKVAGDWDEEFYERHNETIGEYGDNYQSGGLAGLDQAISQTAAGDVEALNDYLDELGSEWGVRVKKSDYLNIKGHIGAILNYVWQDYISEMEGSDEERLKEYKGLQALVKKYKVANEFDSDDLTGAIQQIEEADYRDLAKKQKALGKLNKKASFSDMAHASAVNLAQWAMKKAKNNYDAALKLAESKAEQEYQKVVDTYEVWSFDQYFDDVERTIEGLESGE